MDEHSGYNRLQAAVLEGDYDTVTKASYHLESFVEEMNHRTTGEKAFLFPGKPAADILSAVKQRKESCYLFGAMYKEFIKIGTMYKEFIETDATLTELHSCAKRNDVEMVIELVLNDGIDVNVAAKRNITPLLWASPAASSLSIRTLIDLGADINAQTFQDSTCCFYSGTALHSAIHGNNAAVVKVLLANNANVSIGDQNGNTALHLSASKRLFNISQLLIESGCEVNGRNYSGESPLHCAVRGKNLADVKLLLQNNTDVNIQDTLGNTPLHISTVKGFCNISQLLINCGCKINLRNSMGETPLHSAVRGKNITDVELLLKNRVDTNLQDTLGNTPLHVSMCEGFSNISQLLMDFGCNVNKKNSRYEMPLYSAVHGKN